MQTANWHLKIFLILLIIRKMQTNAIMRYYCIPARMAIIKEKREIRVDKGLMNLGSAALLVGVQNSAATVENSLADPPKLNRLTLCPSSSPPTCVPSEESRLEQALAHQHSCSTIHNGQKVEVSHVHQQMRGWTNEVHT